MKLSGLNETIENLILSNLVLFEDKKEYLKFWFAFEPVLLHILEKGTIEKNFNFIVNHNDLLYKGVTFSKIELVRDYIILYCNFDRE